MAVFLLSCLSESWLVGLSFILPSYGLRRTLPAIRYMYSFFYLCYSFQPLRLDIKRKLSARSDRVKSVDLHPTEPWMLASLYNGNVHIWNFESQVDLQG